MAGKRLGYHGHRWITGVVKELGEIQPQGTLYESSKRKEVSQVIEEETSPLSSGKYME